MIVGDFYNGPSESSYTRRRRLILLAWFAYSIESKWRNNVYIVMHRHPPIEWDAIHVTCSVNSVKLRWSQVKKESSEEDDWMVLRICFVLLHRYLISSAPPPLLLLFLTISLIFLSSHLRVGNSIDNWVFWLDRLSCRLDLSYFRHTWSIVDGNGNSSSWFNKFFMF